MNAVYESQLEEKPSIKDKFYKWLEDHPKTKKAITIATISVPVTIGTAFLAFKIRSDAIENLEDTDFESLDSEPIEV